MCLAVPLRIISVKGTLATVEMGGVVKEISLALTPEARAAIMSWFTPALPSRFWMRLRLRKPCACLMKSPGLQPARKQNPKHEIS